MVGVGDHGDVRGVVVGARRTERTAHRTQRDEQVGRGGWAVVGVLRGGLRDQPVDGGGHGGDGVRRLGHRAVHVLVGDVDGGVAGESLLAGDHLEQQQPGGVDVGAGVCGAVFDLFGREVGGGAEQDVAVAGEGAGGDRAGEAEVGHLHLSGRADQHVLRFDVAVHDAGAVRCGQPVDHRVQQAERFVDGQRSASTDQLAQRLAEHQLHRQEGVVAVRPLVGDRHDVRVGQARRGVCLAAEPRDECVVAGQVGAHHLERDVAFEAQVGRDEHRAHSAVGEVPGDAVSAVDHPSDDRRLTDWTHPQILSSFACCCVESGPRVPTARPGSDAPRAKLVP